MRRTVLEVLSRDRYNIMLKFLPIILFYDSLKFTKISCIISESRDRPHPLAHTQGLHPFLRIIILAASWSHAFVKSKTTLSAARGK